eukprot:m.486251 g.486251  ORF g.486251 m.486251 type:complete len:1268 (+) comp24272_c0_seq1:109-3912(+)
MTDNVTLVTGYFLKRGIRNTHNWKARHFEIRTGINDGGKLLYRENKGSEVKGTLKLKGQPGTTDPRKTGGVSLPLLMPSDVFFDHSGLSNVQKEQRGYVEVADKKELHFVAKSAAEATVIATLCNCADLADRPAGAAKVLKAFLTLTDPDHPLLEFSRVTISGRSGYNSNAVNKCFPYSKQYNDRPEYKWKKENLKQYFIWEDKPAEWRITDAKKDKSRFALALQAAPSAEKLGCIWHVWNGKSWEGDENMDMTLTGNLNVNLDKLLHVARELLKKRDAMEKVAQDPDNLLGQLVKRLSWRYPATSSPLTSEILQILLLAAKHAESEVVAKALADQVAAPLVRMLNDLETGGVSGTGVYTASDPLACPSIEITGRLAEKSYSKINGWYTVAGTHAGRPYYTKPFSHYLYWYEPSKRWQIGNQVGDSKSYCFCKDDVQRVEATASGWYVFDKTEDGVDEKFELDPNVSVGCQIGDLYQFRHKENAQQGVRLLEVLTLMCTSATIAKALVTAEGATIMSLMKRTLWRVKGPLFSEPRDKVQLLNRRDIVGPMITFLEVLTSNRSAVSDFLLGGPDGCPLDIMIDVFLEGTKCNDPDDRIMLTMRCNPMTLVDAVHIPVFFRHNSDPRMVAIRKRLVDEVTPRLLDIALEMTEADVDFVSLAENRVPRLIGELGLLSELPAAAKCVADRTMAVNKILTIVERGTATGMDKLTKETTMTVTAVGKDTEAYKEGYLYEEVLALIATMAEHAHYDPSRDDKDEPDDGRGSSIEIAEIVNRGIYRADPVPVLCKVLQVRTTDLCNILAADALFTLSRQSGEHRDTIERNGGVEALLQLLKTGTAAGQVRAASALALLLQDNRSRQSQFIEAGGCRPVVRLLEHETGELSFALQRILMRMTSFKESADAIIDAKAIPTMLGLLERDSMDIDSQIRIAKSLLTMCFFDELIKQLADAGVPSVLEGIVKRKGKDPEKVVDDIDPDDVVKQREAFHSSISADDDEDDGLPKPERLEHIIHSVLFWVRGPKPQEQSSGDAPSHDVFISYNWSNKNTAARIRAALEAKGYKVWMDETDMRCNLLDGMSGAVEGAKAMIMAYSSKYQNSVNCRHEVEYARKLNKPIIPARMEADFDPKQGWLNFVLGMKLYHDFSREVAFNDSFAGMLKDLEKVKSGGGDAFVVKDKKAATTVAAVAATPAAAAAAVATAAVADPPSANLPPGALSEYLEGLGLLDAVGPHLQANAVDSLDDLADFSTQELVAMGVKWGPAKKLAKALGLA